MICRAVMVALPQSRPHRLLSSVTGWQSAAWNLKVPIEMTGLSHAATTASGNDISMLTITDANMVVVNLESDDGK